MSRTWLTPLRSACYHAFYQATGRSYLIPEVGEHEAAYHLPRAELESRSRKLMVDLLTHAIQTVPYYREVAAPLLTDLREENVHEILPRLPVLTKAIIREQGLRLKSERPGAKELWNTSGGSTGEPVRLMQDSPMRCSVTINKTLYMRWLGWREGEGHLLIWGVPRETMNEGTPLRERVYCLIHNQVYLNCYRLTDALMAEWVGQVNRLRPSVIEAYVDAAFELSKYILARGIKVHRPRGIITSAGVLRPHMQETMEKAFGCPVLNRYGSREVGDVACTCPRGRELHVSELIAHIEVVDDRGGLLPDGEEGNVLVTLLTNRTMPLIRYRIEDRAAFATGPCACGRTTRRLAAVAGRETDYLVAADGSRVSGIGLTTLLYRVEGIRQYQFRQAGSGAVEILIAPRDEAGRASVEGGIDPRLAELRRLVGGLPVSWRFVEEIPPSASGKFRYILREKAEPAGAIGRLTADSST